MPRTPIAALLGTSLTPEHSSDPAYIFALSLLPPTTALCALTSANVLHLLDTSTLSATRTISTPHTLLRTYSPHVLLTAGQSSALTLHDVRMPGTSAVSLAAPHPVASIAVSPTGLLAAGTESGESKDAAAASVLVWDVRSGAVVRRYTESHNDDVATVAWARDAPTTRLASGGTDAMVNVFDMAAPAGRGGGEADDEVDGAVVDVSNHANSVRCVGWLAHDAVWALSHDEVLAVYGRDEETRVGDVRALVGAEYVVDVVQHGEEAWVVTGNMKERWVDLVPFEAGTLREDGYRLVGGHGEEVCRDVALDVGAGTMFTGGEDGTVKAWRPPTSGVAEEEREERKTRKKKGRTEEGENKKKRYKPY